jgi:hypothetical protein
MKEPVNSQVDEFIMEAEESSAGLDFELLDRRLKDHLMCMIKRPMLFKYHTYTTSGVSSASPAHVGESLTKDMKLLCVGDDRVMTILVIGWRLFNNELKSLKNTTLSPINGVD